VEAHGGRIQAHSRPGGGAVFSFTLPVVPSAAVAQAQLRTPPDATPGIGSTTRPLRVLVADDDAVSRKLAVMALMELGHQADEVDDGESALQALNERHYDVVLMDIEMQRLDGIDAARRIASEWAPERRPRIIAVTVSTRREDRERCLAAGMDDYVSKPLRLQTLARKLGRAPEPAAASMPVSPPGPCPIDAQRFAELELLDAAAPGALADLIVTFLQQARPQLELILAAVRAGDSPALRRAAHGFKGTCETIGAVALAAQCGQLETHADLAQARAVLPRLEREFELACAWLAAAPATTTPAA
jgi:CheY-like chemotaxis protein